jgi:hypothetical protein
MKKRHYFQLIGLAAILAGFMLGTASCEKEKAGPAPAGEEALDFRNNGQSAARCVNFHHTAEAVPLGFVCLPAPLNVCGFGATPSAVSIGDISGLLSSVVTSQTNSGNGALHFSLIHYFEADGGQGAFWTEDKAVCTPAGNDPTTCVVHDVLQIVGGTGVFANAGGQMRNHGTIDFVNLTLSVDLRGRVCGDGL